MKTISKVEQEVNQIRLKIYEKAKDMTPAELTEYNSFKSDLCSSDSLFLIEAFEANFTRL
jgi:hypothetical protein